MSTPYLGEIKIFAGNFAPTGWALCEGQLMPIAQNTALFSIIGTFYGGDGVTTFGLPDLQSRVPVGMGQGAGLSPYALGERAGSETITLTTQQMPGHGHALAASDQPRTSSSPVNGFLAGGGYYGSTSDTQLSPTAVEATGGGQPHSNLQPYLALTFIIALQGIFPSRS
jgi:microcystin-dependent protein